MNSDPSNDIAELRRENAFLKAQLADQKQRFREIRHRVKNELQVFTALFAAQRARCGHPDDCSLCVSRIAASAALHQALDADAKNACRLGDFISRLAEMLRLALGGSFESVVTVTGDADIDYARAKCVGLVLVEATMNALKHGFADPASGRIETSLECADDLVVLIVENDATPLAAKLGEGWVDDAAGNGVRLMRDMTKQLGGSLDISGDDGGTRLRLAFPLTRPAEERR